MHVFKTFFKISKKYLASFFMYTGIFLAIALTMMSQNKESSVKEFKSTKLKISVIDNDNTSLSKGLYKYLDSKHKMTEVEENLDAYRDALYSRTVDYILIIPKGFEQATNNGENNSLETYKSPASIASQFADMQINNFVSIYSAYKNSGLNDDEAYENTLDTLSKETDTTVYNGSNKKAIPDVHYFYNYIPYIFISIILMTVTPILMVFNKTEVKKRNLCSCNTAVRYNISLGLGALVFSLAVFAIYAITSIVLYNDSMLSVEGGLRLLNAFTYTLISLSLSYLIAQLTNNENLTSVFANIIGLGSSFLCGVFVPREYLGDSVVTIGKFFPAHWYINVEEAILDYSGTMSDKLITGYAIQLLYAVAIFVLGVVAYRLKKTR